MTSLTTKGVNVDIKVDYHTESDTDGRAGFIFIYHISVSNRNRFPVQLLSRHWRIFDSNGEVRYVDGEGVVGLQPIIEPDQVFEYSSFCNLNTELGTMSGTYTLENLHSGDLFEVDIPKFELATPTILN